MITRTELMELALRAGFQCYEPATAAKNYIAELADRLESTRFYDLKFRDALMEIGVGNIRDGGVGTLVRKEEKIASALRSGQLSADENYALCMSIFDAASQADSEDLMG